ncbi:MAG: ATP-binding protein [Anaerolineae bacterium]
MPKEKVLVVDDEPDILDLCIRSLEAEGYNVKAVDGGLKAIELARREHFDLVLTDICMPDIGGLETTKAIKKIDNSTICITMTGYSTMDTAIEALKLGVDEYLLKPFLPDELCRAVSKAMDKERLRRENARLRALIPLFELNKSLMAATEVSEVLELAVKFAQEETEAYFAFLWPSNSIGRPVCFPPEPRLPHQESFIHAVVDKVAREGEQLTLKPDDPLLEKAGFQSLIATPLRTPDRLVGVLLVAKNMDEEDFAPGDAELLSVLGGQVAIAIENALLFGEIQKAYDELKKLDRLKSEFINIAAHELRTPLAILMGYASILEEEATGEDRERLEILMRNAMRLRTLINDMLDLDGLETGRHRFRLESFSLAEAISSAMHDLSLMARDKGHEVLINLPDDLPEICADRRKFNLVLLNLLSNAIKFTPPGGRIEIEARVEGDEVVVSVRDNGIGIPPEEQERIFDRFYQVGDSLTREQGGMGLGLSIAKGMVELCGGRIWVESEVGRGSTFIFTMPRQIKSSAGT